VNEEALALWGDVVPKTNKNPLHNNPEESRTDRRQIFIVNMGVHYG